MATINKTPSGTFKVLIRKAGLSPQIKTFKNKSNAEKWARLIESEINCLTTSFVFSTVCGVR
jgi:hypothetical protein